MKYLITGGAGFIGSHIAEELISMGHDPVIIDDLSGGHLQNLPESGSVHFTKAKVQDISGHEVEPLLENVAGIFHLAAQVVVQKSIEDFYESSSNNLLSAIRVFEWGVKKKIPVVYASSSAVYGKLDFGDESSELLSPLSPYAVDKLAIEYYAKVLNQTHALSTLGFRLFNVYGHRQTTDNPYSGVISIFIDRVLKKQSVQVNGGNQTRDFVYVKDVVRTLIRGMEKAQKEVICHTLNVGTGQSVTINDLLSHIFKITGYETPIVKKTLPMGDPEKSGGNYNKIKEILGVDYSEFTDIQEGLKKTIAYARERL